MPTHLTQRRIYSSDWLLHANRHLVLALARNTLHLELPLVSHMVYTSSLRKGKLAQFITGSVWPSYSVLVVCSQQSEALSCN